MKKFLLVSLFIISSGVSATEPLAIKKQGSFSVGGKIIKREGKYDNLKFVGWTEQNEVGQSYRADHAFVNYQIPINANRFPLVFIHGFGGSGVCWEMTPDGRDGFTTLMLAPMLWTYLVGVGQVEHPIKQKLNQWLMKCFGLIYGG